MDQHGGSVLKIHGVLGSIVPITCSGCCPGSSQKVTAIDTVKAGLDTVLPGMVPGAILGQANAASPHTQRVNVRAKTWASVVLQQYLAT